MFKESIISRKRDSQTKVGEANGARKHYMKRNIEIVKNIEMVLVYQICPSTVYLSTALGKFVR